MDHRTPLVQSLLIRDGNLCQICKRVIDNPLAHATIDHIYPKHAGGSNDISNLQLSHQSCNTRKGRIIGYKFQSYIDVANQVYSRYISGERMNDISKDLNLNLRTGYRYLHRGLAINSIP